MKNLFIISILLLSCSNPESQDAKESKNDIKEFILTHDKVRLRDLDYNGEISLKDVIFTDSLIYFFTRQSYYLIHENIEGKEMFDEFYKIPLTRNYDDYQLINGELCFIKFHNDTIRIYNENNGVSNEIVKIMGVSREVYSFYKETDFLYVDTNNNLMVKKFPFKEPHQKLFQFDEKKEISDLKKINDSTVLFFVNEYSSDNILADHNSEIYNVPYILNLYLKKTFKLSVKDISFGKIKEVVSDGDVIFKIGYSHYNSYFGLFNVDYTNIIYKMHFSDKGNSGKISVTSYQSKVIEVLQESYFRAYIDSLDHKSKKVITTGGKKYIEEYRFRIIRH